MIRSIAVALGALIVAGALNQGIAQETDPQPTPGVAGRPKQMPFRGKIVGVDPERKVITLGGKERDRTFVVTAETKIRKDGKSAKLEEIRPGDSVGGLARAKGETWEVVTLNVGEKPDKAKNKEDKLKQDDA